MLVHNGRLGEAEGAAPCFKMILLKKAAQVACVSNYVMLKIPCVDSVPVADICSRVKYVACPGSSLFRCLSQAVTQGQFCRPSPCEQAHAAQSQRFGLSFQSSERMVKRLV